MHSKKMQICVILFLLIMIASTCVGCNVKISDSFDSTEVTEESAITDIGLDSNKCHDYRDPETGVHYIIFDAGGRGGISVRYNADGSLYVD